MSIWAAAVGKLFGKAFDSDNVFMNILGSSIVGFLNQPFGLESLKKAQFGPGLILNLPISSFVSDFSNSQGDIASTPDVSQLNQIEDEDARKTAASQYGRALARAGSSFDNQLRFASLPLLRLLKGISNVNVLSTPQLTTLDNVQAFIEVGENAPVGLTSTATAGALSQNSVDRKDITLRLDITPRINPESRTVQMDIKQKFDDFSNRSSSASDLADKGVHIIKRQIETQMVLNDGETAVLGGLLTDKEVHSEKKVPLLGDIPVLGWLFRGSTVKKEKRNLLVFITPTIIKGEKQKSKTKEILGKKLEERIHFIKKYMRGRDPHGDVLNRLLPESQSQKRKWFWQKSSPAKEESSLDKKPDIGESEVRKEPLGLEKGDQEFLGEGGESLFEKEEDLSPEDYRLAVPGEESTETESNPLAEKIKNTDTEEAEWNSKGGSADSSSAGEDRNSESDLLNSETKSKESDILDLGDKELEFEPLELSDEDRSQTDKDKKREQKKKSKEEKEESFIPSPFDDFDF